MAQDQDDAASSTFFATDYDAGKAEEACRKLAGSDMSDSGVVGEAMGIATQAFPGLQDFVDGMDEREEDVRDAALNLDGVPAGQDERLLRAAAKLALVGAIAEVSQGFDWQDAVDCGALCRKAVAGLPERGSAPGLR